MNLLKLKMVMRLLSVSLGLSLLCAPILAQQSTGRILGSITDQSGGAVVGATVTVTDTQRGTTRSLTTNDAGEYNAPDLTPGTYAVKAEYRGFKATERQNIGIEVGNEYRVDLTLQPGEQTQTITVSESLPLVETTSAVLGGTISNLLIGDLPVGGRNYTKLLELRPGVYLNPGSGKWSQSSNGMRNEHNVYILDGIDTIEGFSSQSVVNATGVFGDSTSILPIDAIQEFNTQEVPKAEYGWKPGAIVNVGLKAGTNSLHGTAYAFGRTDALDAANPFITPGSPKQTTDIKDFGGTVGGPIVKDKLFFLLGYEGQRNNIGSPSASLVLPTTASLIATGVPSATAITQSVLDACNALAASAATRGSIKDLSVAMAGLTHAPGASSCGVGSNGVFQNRTTLSYSADPVGVDTLDGGVAKIDYHISDRHTLSGDAFVGNYDSLAPQNNGAAQDYWDTQTHAKSMVYGLQWTWLPTSTVVNEARAGASRYNQQSYPGDCLSSVPHPDYSYLANLNTNTNPLSGVGLPSNCGFPNITISGGFSGLGCCGSFPKIQGPDITLDFLDNVSYNRGRHSFKVGYEMRHLEYIGGTYGGSKGSFSFTNLTNFLTGTLNASNGASLLVGQPQRDITEWGYAAFAQDDWRMTNRFTINAGLRYETVTPMHDANDQLARFDPTSATGLVQQGPNSPLWQRHNNFSPRLGFAWDLGGNAKWVLRGGASIIYVIEGYNAFVSQQGLAGISVLGLNFDPTAALLGGVPGPGTITTGNVQFPQSQVNWTIAGPVLPSGALRCDSPLAPGGGAAAAPNNKPCPILSVSPDFNRPYAGAWNLSVQHAFSNNVSLQLAYVGTHGTGLMGLNDINAPAAGSGWATLPAGGTKCVPIAPASIAAASVNTTCENISRPYFSKFPYLSNIIQISNQDVSNYNALQATLTGRPSHGLSYLVGYTFGHALGEADGDWNGSSLPRNPASVRQDYAATGNDVRHRMTVSLTYALPGKKGFAQMLEGWRLNSVVNVQSALPWNVSDTTNDISGNGLKTDAWDFFGDPTAFDGMGPGSIPYFGGASNTDCKARASALDAGSAPLFPGYTFTNALARYGCYEQNGAILLPPAFGALANVQRNLFRGIGLKLWDLSVTKDVKFSERLSGQFRIEGFNILNKTQYTPSVTGTMAAAGNFKFGSSGATPDVQVSNPSVGSGAPRGFQMGLKLSF